MSDVEKNDPVAEEQQVDGKALAGDEGDEDAGDATWSDVCRTCCCHPPIVWAMIAFRLFWVIFFLFFFILGLEILGDGAQVLTGCVAGALFGDDQNPVSSLMIGILVTCLLQSSSTTTSIIVTLVGAGAVSVDQGIYMVFGGTNMVRSSIV
jgi:solute carrier family 34 (sodium-dependent phosphate cotransporter)